MGGTQHARAYARSCDAVLRLIVSMAAALRCNEPEGRSGKGR